MCHIKQEEQENMMQLVHPLYCKPVMHRYAHKASPGQLICVNLYVSRTYPDADMFRYI